MDRKKIYFMKNLSSVKTIIIGLMIAFANYTFANTIPTQDIPKVVVDSFSVKYPYVLVKSWEIKDQTYTAKFLVEGRKYWVAYDQKGNWLTTISKINWTWKLPKQVLNGLKHSQYASFKVNGIKDVQTPSKHFYQVLVDDSTAQPDADHAAVFTQNYVLEFDTGGVLFSKKSISSPLLF